MTKNKNKKQTKQNKKHPTEETYIMTKLVIQYIATYIFQGRNCGGVTFSRTVGNLLFFSSFDLRGKKKSLYMVLFCYFSLQILSNQPFSLGLLSLNMSKSFKLKDSIPLSEKK